MTDNDIPHDEIAKRPSAGEGGMTVIRVPQVENRGPPQRPLVRRNWENDPEYPAEGRPSAVLLSDRALAAK
jgi:hypothetical protein